jgi:hypothetical protein
MAQKRKYRGTRQKFCHQGFLVLCLFGTSYGTVALSYAVYPTIRSHCRQKALSSRLQLLIVQWHRSNAVSGVHRRPTDSEGLRRKACWQVFRRHGTGQNFCQGLLQGWFSVLFYLTEPANQEYLFE